METKQNKPKGHINQINVMIIIIKNRKRKSLIFSFLYKMIRVADEIS